VASRALFTAGTNDTFMATPYSRGPWDDRHCHGGPVAALLARAVECCEPGDVEWQLARLTVELTRPVPVGRRLALSATTERPGKRVSLVGAMLYDDGTEVARARGLRIRADDLPIPDGPEPSRPSIPLSPQDSRPERPFFGWSDPDIISFARHACEHRVVTGSWNELGSIVMWIRLAVPVLAGEVPNGAQRAVAAADFGNGVSRILDWEQYLFINPDLTVNLARQPRGEWIGLDAVTHVGPRGAGLAESTLHDVDGPIGRAAQSLYVDHR
jgi:Acyl-CoA thioesterase C-terminal domain/Acyl-CoA thioesterase N-terminal domain